MVKQGLFSHDCAFLLLTAAIMLMFSTISAPIINDIAMLEVKLTNGSYVKFGTFGHCVTGTAPIIKDKDVCSGRSFGYSPLLILSQVAGTSYDSDVEKTVQRLTRSMVLHPVGCGVSTVAFITAIGSAYFGNVLPSLLSVASCLLSLAAVACDFTAFDMVKKAIKKDGSGNKPHFSVGIWMVLTATLITMMVILVLLLAVCSGPTPRRAPAGDDEAACRHEPGNLGSAAPKRHFWQR
ncbi:hypothetical protein B2J93_5344 [Marssonina coronariae]|uniref:Uncharacterized protein n=1 Tax=Diplocarpon coronariae TaxID=2795749 RepID=A0A218YU37_9HELO|nr:hypothetical protein B2J93_5344 [Marssonina coronariae]